MRKTMRCCDPRPWRLTACTLRPAMVVRPSFLPTKPPPKKVKKVLGGTVFGDENVTDKECTC